jgi:hypothetical protein
MFSLAQINEKEAVKFEHTSTVGGCAPFFKTAFRSLLAV